MVVAMPGLIAGNSGFLVLFSQTLMAGTSVLFEDIAHPVGDMADP
jgi:hypothetical protein